MKHRNSMLVTLAAVIALITGGAAAQPAFHEDFSTDAYLGVGTADWDSTAGTLRIAPFSPSLLGAFDTPGDARGVAVSGDVVCVADGANGLLVLDVTDPAAPALLGAHDTAGNALRVVVDGDLAFVADGAGGLVVVDIADPTLPTPVAVFGTGGVATGVAVSGDCAYVANGLAGLAVIDIANPAVPALVGTYDTASYANDVVVAGETACVADGNGGVAVIRVAQPAAPVLLGTYDTAGYATNLAISGTLLYVADGAGGLLALDLTDPAAPAAVGSFGAYPAYDVAVAGDVVCTAAGASGLVRIDFTDPGAPDLVGICAVPGYGWGVAIDGETAFLGASTFGLATVGIQVPLAPVFRNVAGTAAAVDVVVAGDIAVAATTSPDALVFLDISDPAGMTARETYALSAPPVGLAMNGRRVVVAGGAAGVRWLDAVEPGVLVTFDTPGFAVDVAAAGGLAFVADSGGGLAVVDMTNQAYLAQYESAVDIVGVAVAGNIAYVSRGLAGVAALDITDPAVPAILGFCDTPGTAGRLVVAGDHAYVADGAAGLAVLDVGDPAAMSLAGSLAVGNVVDVGIAGNRVFCLRAGVGVTTVDVADPAAPTEESAYSVSGMAALAVAGEHMYVAFDSGLSTAVRSYQVAQHDIARSTASQYSLVLPFGTSPVVKIRLTSAHSGDVDWQVTSLFGWMPVVGAGWLEPPTQDRNVRWLATLNWHPVGPPVVDEVLIEVLHRHPDIMSVTDVGNDQGRQVSLDWCRSGHDFYGDAQQIVEYAVYRRIDGVARADAALPAPDLDGVSPAAREHAAAMQAAGWHFLTTVPVRTQDRYAVVVPTLADSTVADGQHYSVFMVSALTATPGLFHDSPPDSGYSLDNLAPGVPAGVAAAYTADAVVLDWADAPEADFRYFRVYRGTDPLFVPGPEDLVHETAASAWTDPTDAPWNLHYKVTAVDFAGNEGLPGAPASVSGVSDGEVPARTGLAGAVPNPFNPATTLHFQLASPGRARVRVFDAAGRLVATLLDGHRAAGRHQLRWDGRDDTGRMSAAGVYFCRLDAGGFAESKRMLLIK